MTHLPKLTIGSTMLATALLMTAALPASAADLKKLADELVNQSEPPATMESAPDGTGDLDGDGHGDVSARGIEKSDIRRGMKVDEGNALNARQPDKAQPGKAAGDPIPDIDITVNQGH
jgi:hypothetical protein